MGVRASYHPRALYFRTPYSAPAAMSSQVAGDSRTQYVAAASGTNSRRTRELRTLPSWKPQAGL
jgi:hypothetical protein